MTESAATNNRPAKAPPLAAPATRGTTGNIITPKIQILQPAKVLNPNAPEVQRAQRLLDGSSIQLTSDLLSACEFFDDRTFYPAFSTDMRRAKGRVLIQSTYARYWRVNKLRPDLHPALVRDVRICITIQRPRPNETTYLNELESVVKLLRSFGAHVTIVEKVHVKVIVFDEDRACFGSLNALSQNDSGEEMICWNDRAMAQRMIETHNLLHCIECADLRSPGEEALRQGNPNAYFAEVIKNRRELLGLQQQDLASATSLSRAVISKLESGKESVSPETLYRVASKLGLQMRFVPEYLESRLKPKNNDE